MIVTKRAVGRCCTRSIARAVGVYMPVGALMLGVSLPVLAQTTRVNVNGHPIDVAQLDLHSLRGVDPTCLGNRDDAMDPGKTVFERATAARRYRICIEGLSALLVAQWQVQASRMDSPPITSLAVKLQIDAFITEASDLTARTEASADFMNLSWGAGFGYSFGWDDHIEEAVVVDGVIRATKDRTDQPRAVLEFHRFFWCNDGERRGDRGCGPFLAVAASQENLLSGVGVGFIYGRKSKNDTSQQGFSVALGAILDGDVKSLADGFEEGQPLPPGESELRYEEKSRWSVLFFVTRTF